MILDKIIKINVYLFTLFKKKKCFLLYELHFNFDNVHK